jgi:hypothetical protein
VLRSPCTFLGGVGLKTTFFLRFFLGVVEGAYTQQGRAHSRRLHPDWAARPALAFPSNYNSTCRPAVCACARVFEGVSARVRMWVWWRVLCAQF